ncbi:ABC transporter permease [Halalkalibacter oceani]|uniref:Autoinducer 2 import system permease protein LsrD n=1 Tax=Halalkalibacter oceani TaxID=1653776 RepID=A0A9X2DTY1_9BACI|nr:ABC transporter permease [Halalkalibacter oceani]MCM3715303.1 ABC transporter permease [Halalkalibacter oceani]
MKRIMSIHEAPIILFTLIVFFIFTTLSPNFLQMSNLQTILLQITITGIIAIGMTMVILLGGMDLSVGAVLALVATIVGLLVNAGVNMWLAVLLGIVVGALCGAINGFIITMFNIPDIITTLATMYIFRGIAVFVSGGVWVTNFPKEFEFLGQGKLLGISFPVLVLFVLACGFILILGFTRFGRRIYAIGGNKNAARLSGMAMKRTKFFVYLYSGMLSAVAAAIYASNVGSIQASTAALNISFDVIAAVLIGGASIFGGTGTIVGSMFGILLLGIIQNGVIISQFSPYWVDAITGLLIIVAIIINSLKRWKDSLKLEGKLK